MIAGLPNRLAGFVLAGAITIPSSALLDAQMPGTPRITAAPSSIVRGAGQVVLNYQLTASAKQVAIEVTAEGGEIVRQWANAAAAEQLKNAAGSHRVEWDLRADGASMFRTSSDERPAVVPGPVVSPGSYRIRLLLDGRPVASTSVVVGRDPNGPRESDISAHVAFARQLVQRLSTVTAIVDDLRGAKRDVTDRIKNARSPVIGLAGDVVLRKLTEVEVLLAEPALRVPVSTPAPEATLSARLGVLLEHSSAAEQAPPPEAVAAAAALDSEVDALVQRLSGVVTNEVAAFNNLLTNAMMEVIRVPRVPARGARK